VADPVRISRWSLPVERGAKDSNAVVVGGSGSRDLTLDEEKEGGDPLFARLAKKRRTGRAKRRWSIAFFILLVVLPTITAAIYYGFWATSQYATEFQFGVRSADAQRNDATSIFQGMASASQIGLQSNIVVQYVKSREIVDAINRKINLRAMFSKPSIDYLSRLDPQAPIEDLVAYWKNKVEPYFDLTTGIISVRVKAFSPEDALTIGNEIVSMSESLSEELSKRARADYVKFAQEQVNESADRLKKERQALLDFRNQEQTLDPTKEADVARLGIAKLQEDLARARADLKTAQARLSDGSPAIISLRDREKALQDLVREAEAKLTGGEGRPSNPVSRNLRGFEALETERAMAEKFYEMALQSLQRAQFEATRQATYLEVFVRPALAERSLYPRRFISTLTVALVSFGAWIFLLMIYYSVREHI
jgi:capsular polysaccharide transport system permease protein